MNNYLTKPRKLLLIVAGVFFLTNLHSQDDVKAKDAQPIFEDGLSQIVPAFNDPSKWIQEDLWVETEFDTDGDDLPDRMHVAVTRPFQTESGDLQLPIVLNSSPYFAGTSSGASKYFWNPRHELGDTPPDRIHPPEIKRSGERPIISSGHVKDWVPRGYIVVHTSAPGTGLSDGSPTVGGPNESLAPKAVIDWLCGRAKGYTERRGSEEVEAFWSSGKVGMTGTSYNGTIPLAAATTGVEGLEVIIPVAPNTSYYHYYRSHGLIRHPGGWMGEDIDVLYDFIHSGDEAKREYSNKVYRDGEFAANMDRETGDWNEFWAERDYLLDMPNMKAAMLMSHGFNDWNVMPEHSYRIYQAAKEMGLETKIYYHQNGHGGPPPFSMMNRWFTRYLFGIKNDVEKDPNAWIVREDDERHKPTPYPEFPHPEASAVKLYLSGNAPGVGSMSLDSRESEGIETLVDNFSFTGEMLARAEITEHRLLYLSPVLKDSLHLSGVSKINIKVASSKAYANLSVWMVSMPWSTSRRAKITDNIITRGWADIQNHKSLSKSKPLDPGKYYEFSFNMQPDDQVIPAGQQIGLMIFASDKDFTLWPEPGTELSVDLEGTFIEIPVVGGVEALKKATE